jgi:hypothetical protein
MTELARELAALTRVSRRVRLHMRIRTTPWTELSAR